MRVVAVRAKSGKNVMSIIVFAILMREGWNCGLHAADALDRRSIRFAGV
jgi:hypothetical protein